MTVEITVLEESHPAEARSRGDEMAAILERLAESGAVSEITDPVAWHVIYVEIAYCLVERSDAYR